MGRTYAVGFWSMELDLMSEGGKVWLGCCPLEKEGSLEGESQLASRSRGDLVRQRECEPELMEPLAGLEVEWDLCSDPCLLDFFPLRLPCTERFCEEEEEEDVEEMPGGAGPTGVHLLF